MVMLPPALPVVADAPAPPCSVIEPPAVPAVVLPVAVMTELFGAAAVVPLPKYKLLAVSKVARTTLLVLICRLLASSVPNVATLPDSVPKVLPPWINGIPLFVSQEVSAPVLVSRQTTDELVVAAPRVATLIVPVSVVVPPLLPMLIVLAFVVPKLIVALAAA